MSASFEIDRNDTRRLFDGIAKTTGQTTRELLVDVMRLWGDDLVRMTFPRKLSEARKRVETDIRKLFVEGDKLESDSLKKSFRSGDVFQIQGENQELLFRPSYGLNEIQGKHDEKRSPRGGIKRQRQAYVVKGADLRRFIRNKKARVGRLKAGWLAVVNKLGGKAPGWVRKHGASESAYRDTLNAATMEGHLIAENNVPYADQKIDQAFMDLIERKRANDLTKGYYAKRWQKKTEAATKR